ncbi:MAG: DUF1178 family protein [Rhodoferax sp.]
MKVYNLRCQLGHSFEGWFGSEQDYADQSERQLLACPFCDSTSVQKTPSAPRLNLRSTGSQDNPPAPVASEPPGPQTAASKGEVANMPPHPWMQRWLELSRQVVRETEDVGERFAQEARRMHYGEAQSRGIRGQASATEVDALLDEGIEVLPMLLPAAAKATLQ